MPKTPCLLVKRGSPIEAAPLGQAGPRSVLLSRQLVHPPHQVERQFPGLIKPNEFVRLGEPVLFGLSTGSRLDCRKILRVGIDWFLGHDFLPMQPSLATELS